MEETELIIHFGNNFERISADDEKIESFRAFLKDNSLTCYSIKKENRTLVIMKQAITHWELVNIEKEENFDISKWDFLGRL